MKVGTGIFMWTATERRTNRYGMFYPSDANINETVRCVPVFNVEAVRPLVGKRVKIWVFVIINRDSGHFGDAFLGLAPTMPNIGDKIEIGVGPCCLSTDEYSPSGYAVGIKPSDGRETFWTDPRNWYRLHDQTVELHIEETTEPESDDPAPSLVGVGESVVISNGDGTVQMKGSREAGSTIKIAPKLKKIGPGCFVMSPPNAKGNRGDQFDIID